MPCNGGHYFNSRARTQEWERRVDHLTRLLCQCCQVASDAGAELPAELDEWWYEHRLEDEARKAEAKRRAERESSEKRRARYLASVRKRVMGQLTDDEKEALGL